MPLIWIDAYEGRSEAQVRDTLDAIHRATLKAFKVATCDRYQVYQEHALDLWTAGGGHAGPARIRNLLVVTVISGHLDQDFKATLCLDLCSELERNCGVAPCDVVISIVANTDADWSFGNGQARFVTNAIQR